MDYDNSLVECEVWARKALLDAPWEIKRRVGEVTLMTRTPESRVLLAAIELGLRRADSLMGDQDRLAKVDGITERSYAVKTRLMAAAEQLAIERN